MAKLFKVSGEVLEIKPANGKRFTLEELQNLVHGYIQCVPCNSGTLVVDEEGKLKDGATLNVKATKEYGNQYDCIVGDAVLCDNDEIALFSL